jgi:hypothetical protein
MQAEFVIAIGEEVEAIKPFHPVFAPVLGFMFTIRLLPVSAT